MAKAKSKAGKSKKAAKKSAPRKQVRRAAAPKAAPAAQAAKAQAKPALVFPVNMLVKKGAEVLPVQVKDAAHHAQLVEEFGEAQVQVQL